MQTGTWTVSQDGHRGLGPASFPKCRRKIIRDQHSE